MAFLSTLPNDPEMFEYYNGAQLPPSLGNWHLVNKVAEELNNAFIKIDTGLSRDEYGFECECKCRTFGLNAYVKPLWLNLGIDDDIHFCPSYFALTDAFRTSTMGHEFSHYFVGTDDVYEFDFLDPQILSNLNVAQIFEEAYLQGTTPANIEKVFAGWLNGIQNRQGN
jgi:hypothetical protein